MELLALTSETQLLLPSTLRLSSNAKVVTSTTEVMTSRKLGRDCLSSLHRATFFSRSMSGMYPLVLF